MSKTLLLYGEIGWEITSKEVVSWLLENKGETIEIHVNSPGGDVYEAIAIREAIRGVKDCTIYVDSIAASAAAIITLCGKPVKMGQFAQLMIHSASTYTGGNKKKMEQQMEELDKVDHNLAEMIADKMGKTAEDVYSTYFDGEDHWLSAQECVDMGIAELIQVEDRKKKTVIVDSLNGMEPKRVIINNQKDMEVNDFKKISAFADCADEKGILAKASAMADTIEKATAKIAELETISQKYNDLIAQLEKERNEADMKKIEDAIKDGRLAEEQKDAFVALLNADRENTLKVIENMTAKPKVDKPQKKVEDYINEGKQTKVVMDSWSKAMEAMKK